MPPPQGINKRAPLRSAPDPGQDEGSPRGGRRVTDHVRTAEEIIRASRKRREGKRRAIEKVYKEEVEKVRAKVETYYQDRKKKMIEAQMAQWDQLSALLDERKSIEVVILEHLQRLEDSTLNLSMELSTIYEGRLEEILELNATGKMAVNNLADRPLERLLTQVLMTSKQVDLP